MYCSQSKVTSRFDIFLESPKAHVSQGGIQLTASGGSQRNRSEGWQFAKLSGHQNEDNFGDYLRGSVEAQNALFSVLKQDWSGPDSKALLEVDGTKKVLSILSDMTTSKVDLSLRRNAANAKISLKKSASGQVWLISVPRFISAVSHYGAPMPEGAKRALRLFIGGSNLANLEDVFAAGLASESASNSANWRQEVHQQRLLSVTLQRVCAEDWTEF